MGTRERRSCALVLSGGGTRGAYEVGVLSGLTEVLDPKPGDPPLFQIFVGTSVGAINATWLAANAHLPDYGVPALVELWQGLKLKDHLRTRLFGWRTPLRRMMGGARPEGGPLADECLLDPTPLERLIDASVPWDQLHRNIADGVIDGLLIPALEVATGVTWVFAEMAPQAHFEPTRDARRRGVHAPVTIDHVMASAAIPVLFPPRRIGETFFYDGGLRFNTPIAPAIRAGADHLVVVSPVKSAGPPPPPSATNPGLSFLAGKAFNALLLDPMGYDLSVLQRFNTLIEVLEEVLDPADLARVQEVLAGARGLPYRKLDTLVFSPSADLGQLAVGALRENLDAWEVDWLTRWLLRRLTGGRGATSEADWTSFVLFEGDIARQLITEGRRDALDRADEIRAFFGRGSATGR